MAKQVLINSLVADRVGPELPALPIGQEHYAQHVLGWALGDRGTETAQRLDARLSVPMGVLMAFFFFCMAVTASIVCFKIYENPVRLKLRSLLKRKPHSAVAIET
jgi:hypothetical protein